VLIVTVPAFDLGRSYKSVTYGKCLKKVLNNSGNLFLKLCGDPADEYQFSFIISKFNGYCFMK